MALDARTGKLVWAVNTILPASNSSATSTYGTGGAWETPLVGSDGSVTFGVGNPYQTAASAIAHPSAQLYSNTGAIVYEHKLPTSTNAPIAIAGNTILVPAGGPNLYGPKGGSPQLVAYTVP